MRCWRVTNDDDGRASGRMYWQRASDGRAQTDQLRAERLHGDDGRFGLQRLDLSDLAMDPSADEEDQL